MHIGRKPGSRIVWCVASLCVVGYADDDWRRPMEVAAASLDGGDSRACNEAARRIGVLLEEHGQDALEYLEDVVLPSLARQRSSEAPVRVVQGIVAKYGRSRLRWWTETSPSPLSVPNVVADGDVIACTGEGGLTAFSRDGSGLLWSKPGHFDKPVPGIVRGVVYAYRPPNSVVAYRGRDGEVLWAQSFEDLGMPAVRFRRMSTPNGEIREQIGVAELRDTGLHAVLDRGRDRMFVAVGNTHVVAVTFSGKRVWAASAQADEKGLMLAPVVASEDVVLCGYWQGTRRLFALSSEGGTRRWTINVPVASVPPVVSGELAVFALNPRADGRVAGEIRAVAIADGKEQWAFDVASGLRDIGTAAGGGAEVVVTQDGHVERGNIDVPGGQTMVERLFVTGDLVLAETRERRMCLRAFDGQVLWSAPRGGSRFEGAERDGVLFGVSESGAIQSLDPRSGRVARRIALATLQRDLPSVLGGHVEEGVLSMGLGRLSRPWICGESTYVVAEAGCLLAVEIPKLRSRSESPDSDGASR